MVDSSDRLKWWSDARFGMLIHWGLYSLTARGEWLMDGSSAERSHSACTAIAAAHARVNPTVMLH